MNVFEYILSKQEIEIIKFIARVGFYEDSYRKDLKISERTVTNCVSKNIIESDKKNLLFTKQSNIYRLSDKGKMIAKKLFFIDPYKSKSSQLEHDYVLGKVYLNLSEEERETWRTETTLMLLHPSKAVVDAIYQDLDGNIVGVEIITDGYSKAKIDDKKNFINLFCDKELIVDLKEIY